MFVERAENSSAAKYPSSRAGFTLIELLVVLVILGLLAALAAPRVINYLGGAKTDAAELQIQNFKSALDLYRLDVGGYPSTTQGLKALVEEPTGANGWRGPYLDSSTIPLDPWGNDYGYRAPGEHGNYDLLSLGADNGQGGDGENADVTSWTQ